MDTAELAAHVQKVLDGGAGDELPGAAGERFLPLVTLDSGARCGLDREARWLLVPDDGRPVVRFGAETAHLFHEPLEWKRGRFEDEIEASAKALGLPATEVVYAYPAVEIVRAVLAKQASYLTRLALEWILPSERRELRADIAAVTKQEHMPQPVKQLADRLLVRE